LVVSLHDYPVNGSLQKYQNYLRNIIHMDDDSALTKLFKSAETI